MFVGCGDDVAKLQGSLDHVSHWCFENRLYLNLKTTFSRSKDSLFNQYFVDKLCWMWGVNERFGISLGEKLKYMHIKATTNKILQTLGFIWRTWRNFTLIQTILWCYPFMQQSFGYLTELVMLGGWRLQHHYFCSVSLKMREINFTGMITH